MWLYFYSLKKKGVHQELVTLKSKILLTVARKSSPAAPRQTRSTHAAPATSSQISHLLDGQQSSSEGEDDDDEDTEFQQLQLKKRRPMFINHLHPHRTCLTSQMKVCSKLKHICVEHYLNLSFLCRHS